MNGVLACSCHLPPAAVWIVALLADGDAYRLEDFPLPSRPDSSPLPALGGTLNLDQLEKQMIERALRMHHFNISSAASELGLSRGALYRRMEKHGL